MALFAKRETTGAPLPRDFLEWQVELRRFTMTDQHGSPHVGVAPLISVKTPGIGTGFASHSVICGILPAPDQLAQKTEEFRKLYEAHSPRGARELYDEGISYLIDYYESADGFDEQSITTLLHEDLPVVKALEAAGECALLFYVFDLEDRSRIGKLRCVQLDCAIDVLREGPVYDNVWWHNTLFHGPADDHVVVHFKHRATYDTAFGRLERVPNG